MNDGVKEYKMGIISVNKERHRLCGISSILRHIKMRTRNVEAGGRQMWNWVKGWKRVFGFCVFLEFVRVELNVFRLTTICIVTLAVVTYLLISRKTCLRWICWLKGSKHGGCVKRTEREKVENESTQTSKKQVSDRALLGIIFEGFCMLPKSITYIKNFWISFFNRNVFHLVNFT